MPIGIEERANKKRCLPTLQGMGVRLMTVETWRTVKPMAMGMQRTGSSLIAVGTYLSGEN